MTEVQQTPAATPEPVSEDQALAAAYDKLTAADPIEDEEVAAPAPEAQAQPEVTPAPEAAPVET